MYRQPDLLVRFLAVLLAVSGLLATPARGQDGNLLAAQGPQKLVALARIGPWPAISNLIAYRGRMWFVNSVKFIDHNSADIYSFDPKTGFTQYQRQLFSQDAGRPMVADGLLYWPFEDARFSMGLGEYMITNGAQWRWRVVAGMRAFHAHAMLKIGNRLYAVTGAFHGRLAVSGDDGASWRELYRSRDRKGSFSRVVSLARFRGSLYAGLYSQAEPGIKLLRLEDGTLKPVKGWPVGDEATRLTVHQGALYALHRAGGETSLWRSDGARAEQIRTPPRGRITAIASDGAALWALTVDTPKSGVLWRLKNDGGWENFQQFTQDRPLDLAFLDGAPYVGAVGGDGRGVLWGPRVAAPSELPAMAADDAGPPVPTIAPAAPGQALEPLLGRLDRLYRDPRALARRAVMRDTLEAIIAQRSAAAAQALAKRIGSVGDVARHAPFAGVKGRLGAVADWRLIWAMARIGEGAMPPEILDETWALKENPSQKYPYLPSAAAFTAGLLAQKDDAMLARLIARLDRKDDPVWLKGDFVGALSAITGQKLGYDFAAWRIWWQQRTRPKADPANAKRRKIRRRQRPRNKRRR